MKSIILAAVFYLFLNDALGQLPSKFNPNYKPKNLNEAVLQLEGLHHDTIKLKILSMSEDQFAVRSHFEMGMWIRNNWRL